jgi:site-specific DNA recombinase
VGGGDRARAAGVPGRGGVRFAFYGRVSTEDWQDPVTSRARQREQAAALVRGPRRQNADRKEITQAESAPVTAEGRARVTLPRAQIQRLMG